MKHEYRKHGKKRMTKAKPVLLDVPQEKFICIEGEGNSNFDENNYCAEK